MKTTLLLFGILMIIVQHVYSQNKSIMNENNDQSVEIIRYKVPADQAKNFEDAYAKAAEVLQKSSFCLAYEIIHGVDEPQNYIVRIHWTSKDDHLGGFRKSAEFAAFFNYVKRFYNNIEEMKHYEMTKTAWKR
jgi:heme-degrading monooxygenase HmoA